MRLTQLAAAAAIAAGVGMSSVMSAVGVVNTASAGPGPVVQPDPGGPPPGIPAEKCWRFGRQGAGNPMTGGGRPVYLPPCPDKQ